MDNRTVQRALQGDEEAARAVESHLRSAARQLLSHPALQVEDPVTQRVLANAAVAEALERELSELDNLLAATVMAAARRGVEHMRRLQGMQRGAGHLPPGILVSVALVPQILATASRAAAEQHLSSCADCTDQARSVRDAAAAAAMDDDPEEPTAQHHLSAALDHSHQAGVFGLGDSEPSGDAQDAAGAAEAMLQRLLETADAVEAARDAEPSTAQRRRRAQRARKRGEKPIRAAPIIVLALALVAVISRMDLRCSPVEDSVRVVPELAQLASLDTPELPPRAEWLPVLEPGFEELVQGDCPMAANRFRLARLRDPTLVQAWYQEGLAATCAGRGEQAVVALERARTLDASLPQLDWALAQAALLAGREELALAQLRTLCGGTTARVGDACAQLARLGVE